MESRGQLTRSTQGAGRVVNVTLTELGGELVTSALVVHASAVRPSFLGALTADHRRALLALSR